MARERILDPELVFKLVKKLGSYGKAAKYLEEQGIVNPYTGKPFHRGSLWEAAAMSESFHEDSRKEDLEIYRKEVSHVIRKAFDAVD
jgi:hypothetical protein